MEKFSKNEHDTIRRALATHERITGEPAAGLIDRIQVADPESDKATAAKAAQEVHDANARLQARVEETEQARRRAAVEASAAAATGRPAESPGTPANVQPGNPGPGQEAMATERAKAAGFDRKGQEPPSAHPTR